MTESWIESRFSLAPFGRAAEIQLGKMLQPAPISESDKETPYLRAGHLVQLHELAELPTMFSSSGDKAAYAVRPGDLVVAEGGDVGRARFVPEVPPGTIIQNSLHRVRSNTADLRYLRYCLHAAYSSGWLDVVCNRATFGHLTREKLAALRIPLPERRVQSAIADFLDAETARIDALIQKKRQMASLVTERLALRIETELRSFASRDGEVPLRYLASEVTVGIVVTPARYYADDGVPALRGINVLPGRLKLNELVHLTVEGHALHPKSRLRAGELVTVRSGQAGATAVVPPELDGANCVDLLITRPGPTVSPYFLELAMNSDWCKKHIAQHSVGAIQGHFNVEALKQLPIPRANPRTQAEFVDRIHRSRAWTDRAFAALGDQTDLLVEHRQALITSAVTGQLDIARAVA